MCIYTNIIYNYEFYGILINSKKIKTLTTSMFKKNV